VVERRSLTGELSLSCVRPAAYGWPLFLTGCEAHTETAKVLRIAVNARTTTTTTTLHPFNGLFSRTTWVSWYQKGKTSLDLNDARDDGVLGCSGIL